MLTKICLLLGVIVGSVVGLLLMTAFIVWLAIKISSN